MHLCGDRYGIISSDSSEIVGPPSTNQGSGSSTEEETGDPTEDNRIGIMELITDTKERTQMAMPPGTALHLVAVEVDTLEGVDRMGITAD